MDVLKIHGTIKPWLEVAVLNFFFLPELKGLQFVDKLLLHCFESLFGFLKAWQLLLHIVQFVLRVLPLLTIYALFHLLFSFRSLRGFENIAWSCNSKSNNNNACLFVLARSRRRFTAMNGESGFTHHRSLHCFQTLHKRRNRNRSKRCLQGVTKKSGAKCTNPYSWLFPNMLPRCRFKIKKLCFFLRCRRKG